MHQFDFSPTYETAFITGHRYIDRNLVLPALEKLLDMAAAQGTTKILNGMAIGTDQEAAKILIRRQLWWKACIPCQGQEKVWQSHFQHRYRQLLKKANDRVVLADKYYPGCMNARNTYMAKHSDLCLAIYDGSEKGGTFHAVSEARKRGLLIYFYNPKTSKFSIEHPEPKLIFGIDGTATDRQPSNLFQFGINNTF